jgi:predicted acetyltransferase
MHTRRMELVTPALEHLPSYRAAVERGWPLAHTPAENERVGHQLRDDPAGFLAELDLPEGGGRPVTLPTGATVPRLPELKRWMWADGFGGEIALRWQRGTTDLPPYVLGHIGYTVVPWQRRQGHATAALGLMLPLAQAVGLPWVELVTDRTNEFSQRVILANGGAFVDEFEKPDVNGGGPAYRFRIDLSP